jgi:hypothetical protein
MYGASINTSARQDIKLYLLQIALASGISFEVTDETGNAKSDIYIKCQRYYVGNNAYETVAMGKTDTQGNDYIYLRKYDAWYKFVFEEKGRLIYITSPMKIADDSLTFKIAPDTLAKTLKNYRGIDYTHSFNNVTRNFKVVFDDPSGSIVEGCMYVARRSMGNNTQICDNCTSSTSGTLLCNVGNPNETYISVFYVAGSPPTYISGIIADLSILRERLVDKFGTEGLIGAFFIIGTFAVGTLWNPIVAIVACLVGLIVSMMLGMVYVSWGILITMIVIGGILIFKLRT